MTTTYRLSRPAQLAVAIQLMAGRMVDTERDINRGIFLTPTNSPSFLESAEYQRLKRRARYQAEALHRLVSALASAHPYQDV